MKTKLYTPEFKEAIEIARLKLFDLDRYLYILSARLPVVEAEPLPEDPRVKGYTDGAKVYLTPAWLESKELEQVSTLIHEIGHIALNHIPRIKGLPSPHDHNTANIAADLALISLQHGAGVPAWITTFYDGWMQYEGMSMEEIYKLILEDMPEQLKHYKPHHPDIEATEDEIEDTQIEVNQAGIQAASQGFSTDLSKAASRSIEEARAPKIPWNTLLQKELAKKKSSQTTWSRRNRRLLNVCGGRFPAKRRDYDYRAVMAMDVSGSVGSKALNTFGAVATDILHTVATEVHLMTFDTEVVNEWHLTKGQKCHELDINGYRGTEVQVVYDHLEELKVKPHLLIIATDAYLSVPDDPGYPVIWLVSDNKSFKPPYGKVIFLTE